MKKLTTVIMVLSLVLAGVSLVAAADLPQALQGVDLTKAKQVTDQEAQEVRGAMQAGNSYINDPAYDGSGPDRYQIKDPASPNCYFNTQ